MSSNDRAISIEVPYPLCEEFFIHKDLVLSISPLKQQIETLLSNQIEWRI